MQEFSFFERFLILSKDARSPGRGPTSLRRQVPIAGQTADSNVASASKNRPLRSDAAYALLGSGRPGDGGEVLGDPPLKSTPRALGLAAGESGQGRPSKSAGSLDYSRRIAPPEEVG